MSATKIAVMEVPAAGGEVSYRALSLSALKRETHEPRRTISRHDPARLRLFFATGQSSPQLSSSAIRTLCQAAWKLSTNAFVVRLERALSGSSSQSWPHVHYFQLENETHIRELDAAQVANCVVAWGARHPHRPTLPGLIFAVERPDPNLPLHMLWQEFHRTLELSLSPAEIGLEARLGQVLVTQPTITPAQAAEALRQALLAKGWPTSVEVGRANGSQSVNKAQWAKDKRDAGELLGVWSASERAYRHPSFQFTTDGLLLPRVKDLLDALASNPDFAPANDPGGWRKAFWLHGATLALPGPDGTARVPAEVFAKDPDAVVAAARMDAEGDPNAAW